MCRILPPPDAESPTVESHYALIREKSELFLINSAIKFNKSHFHPLLKTLAVRAWKCKFRGGSLKWRVHCVLPCRGRAAPSALSPRPAPANGISGKKKRWDRLPGHPRHLPALPGYQSSVPGFTQRARGEANPQGLSAVIDECEDERVGKRGRRDGNLLHGHATIGKSVGKGAGFTG